MQTMLSEKDNNFTGSKALYWGIKKHWGKLISAVNQNTLSRHLEYNEYVSCQAHGFCTNYVVFCFTKIIVSKCI
jgi:hypothetical protein